jgi:UDP-2,3-diacylglucosamine hydrolase
MLVFVGDLHLGRGSESASRAAERDAVALLGAHRDAMSEPGGGLVLLGDVFNAFMEYGGMVPSGFVRIQGALADLVDHGVDVTYVVGNRDHWHLRHFRDEIGVRLVHDETVLAAHGRRVLVAHGDGQAPSERAYNALRPVLRNRLAHFLYRNVLPGDSGYRLARTLASRGKGVPRPELVVQLRDTARLLCHQRDVELVVMGHSHVAETTSFPAGEYLNPGYWFEDRTYGVLDADGPRLAHWNPR